LRQSIFMTNDLSLSCRRKVQIVSLILLISSLSANSFAQTASSIRIRGKDVQWQLYGSRKNPPVLLSSGDLGWAGLVVHVAEFLSSRGYFVAGLNSRAYLASFTTKSSTLKPEDVPSDFLLILDLLRQETTDKPILAGI